MAEEVASRVARTVVRTTTGHMPVKVVTTTIRITATHSKYSVLLFFFSLK